MAKQIEGVAERILTAAKQEFLEKGYVPLCAPLQQLPIPVPTPFMSDLEIRKGFFPQSLSLCSVK